MLAQAVREAEVTELTGVPKGERNPERRLTHRTGYRERRWDTGVGTIELAVPRVRDGSYLQGLLDPRRRTERALLAVVQEAYVSGVSTRWPAGSFGTTWLAPDHKARKDGASSSDHAQSRPGRLKATAMVPSLRAAGPPGALPPPPPRRARGRGRSSGALPLRPGAAGAAVGHHDDALAAGYHRLPQVVRPGLVATIRPSCVTGLLHARQPGS